MSNEKQAEREAFEAWFCTPEAKAAGHSRGWEGIAWAAWQARAALAQQPKGEAKEMIRDLVISGIAVQRIAPDDFLAPPQAAPVAQGLTDEQIEKIASQHGLNIRAYRALDADVFFKAARAILAHSAPRASAQQAEPHGGNFDEATAKAILAFVNRPGDTYNGYVRRQLGLGFALALKRAIERAQAATAAPAPVASPADQGEDARDAARYRHMRASFARDIKHRLTWYLPAITPMTAEGLDSAIDATMSATPPAAD